VFLKFMGPMLCLGAKVVNKGSWLMPREKDQGGIQRSQRGKQFKWKVLWNSNRWVSMSIWMI